MSKGTKRPRDVDVMAHFKKNKQTKNLDEMLSSLKNQVFKRCGSNSIQHYDSFEDADIEESHHSNFIEDYDLILLVFESSMLDMNIIQMQKQRQELEKEKKQSSQSNVVIDEEVFDVDDADSDATIEWGSEDDDVALLSAVNGVDGSS